MKLTRRTLVIAAGGVCLAAILAVAALVLLSPAPPDVPLPVPNGYADLLKAGSLVRLSSKNVAQMTRSELESIVQFNAEALQVARTGLTRQARVTLDYSPQSQQHIQDLASLKSLAHALVAEATLASLDSRTNEAAASYLDGIRIGAHAERGGVIIDVLVGLAVENLSARGLQSLVSDLDAATARQAARTLEQVEKERETIATVLENERRWSRRTFGYRAQLIRAFARQQYQKTESTFTAKLTQHQNFIRQLMLQCAARAFAVEKGRNPQNAAELVPDYLAKVPKDPLSGQEMPLP